ncbi:MAG: hypothetical protein ACXQS8_03250 [Candidatus Helarchaeales archaeon]
MGIGKAFGLGLLIYMGLNFLAHVLLLVLSNISSLMTYFLGLVLYPINGIIGLVMVLLVGPAYTTALLGAQNSTLIPAGVAIYTHVINIMNAGSGILVNFPAGLLTSIVSILVAIGMLGLWIMPFLVTAIVVGYWSGSPGNGFASWFLLMLITVMVSLVLGLIGSIISNFAVITAVLIPLVNLMVIDIVTLGIPAILVNSCFWGVICIGGGIRWEE